MAILDPSQVQTIRNYQHCQAQSKLDIEMNKGSYVEIVKESKAKTKFLIMRLNTHTSEINQKIAVFRIEKKTI